MQQIKLKNRSMGCVIFCRIRRYAANFPHPFLPWISQFQALRKVFASSDRKRPASVTTSAPSVSKPVPLEDIRADGDWDHIKRTSTAQQLDDNTTGALQCSNVIKEEDRNNMLPEKQNQQGSEAAYTKAEPPCKSDEATETATAPSSSTNEPAWNFDRFLEEQRKKEIQHDDQKERIFQKVRNAFDTHVVRTS